MVLGSVIFSVTVAHALHIENGNTNYRNGQYEEAIQSYNSALSNGENSDLAYMGLAKSYFKQNEFQKAFDSINNIIRENPSSKDALLVKAQMYEQLGEMNNNESQIDKSIEILSYLDRTYPNDNAVTSVMTRVKNKKSSMQTIALAQDEDYQPFQPMTRTNVTSTPEINTSTQQPVAQQNIEQINTISENQTK